MPANITPPLKWHGGKNAFEGKLAKWIISLMRSSQARAVSDSLINPGRNSCSAVRNNLARRGAAEQEFLPGLASR